jgi:hypothetical protein
MMKHPLFSPTKALQGQLMLLFALFAAAPAFAAPQTIIPGIRWNDSSGDPIQAHAPGFVKVGTTYYMFGEDHTRAVKGAGPEYVSCYSSTDLVHWTWRSNALAGQSTGDLATGRVIERPKVVLNPITKTFVMYVHIDSSNYKEAKVGVATSATVIGPYTYVGSFQPSGHQSRDMTVFQDDNGAAYLVYEDRASGVRIDQLSHDYLTVAAPVALLPHAVEGLAVVKIGGVYFMLGSHLTGWATNPNIYATADSLGGPWSDFQEVAPQSANTYDSQCAFILPVKAKQGSTYVYIGDRWNAGNLPNSRYIWLPLSISGKTMSLNWQDAWNIDTTSGLATDFFTGQTIR